MPAEGEKGAAPAAPGPEPFIPEGFELGEQGAGQPPGAPAAEEAVPGELALEEFTLPESVKEFGIAPTPAPGARRVRPAAAPAMPGKEAVEELGGAEVEIELTEEQFSRLKRCLTSLPRNLKIAIQDIVASGGAFGPDLKKLIQLLVSGASPLEIADLAGKITGKKIRLPAGFEKRTGLAFEAEARTFGYAFRENIWPIVRVFVLTALVLAAFLFVGYRYVYQPMYAYTSYATGYDNLRGNRFELANQGFDRATAVWPMKSWFYRYAEGFTDKGQYLQAEQKYDELLRRWPGDKKGIIDYSRMLSTRLLDYQKADSLLSGILDRKMYDFDALLAAGDNDMQWAAEDPKRFEEARIAYASLIERYGQRDELLFRMLGYFIRTDNYPEAERLRLYFDAHKDTKVDPEAYAELGGYLIDKNELTEVQDVLFAALEAKRDLPQIHYNLARYYRLVKDPVEEKKALEGALLFMKPFDVLSVPRLTMEIDTHTRLGELYYGSKAFLDAEKEYKTAIDLVESDQKRKLIGTGAVFGRPYHDLGDLSYYVSGDLDRSFLMYQKAIENRDTGPELDYKIGYIHYAEGNFKAALDSFIRSSEGLPPARLPFNLLYALGNTFFQRDDFFAAQGHYLRLMDMLNDKRAGIVNLQPQEQPDHRALVQNMLRVDNNLGVVTFRISEKMGDRKKRSEALALLAAAAEQYDVLSRDPESMKRSESKNLPSLNMRGILYPSANFDPQIYNLVPKDLEATFF